jgi:hypothetical protein
LIFSNFASWWQLEAFSSDSFITNWFLITVFFSTFTNMI